MADIVRLAIVYDTSQAAAAVTNLTSRLATLNETTQRSQVQFTTAKNRWASTSDIMAAMASDAARAGETIKQLNTPLVAVAGASGQANHATAALKRGLVGLAMQATATSGPVGQLSQALLLMGGGSGLVIGVAAAVGTLALAYRAWTADTRDTAKAQEDLLKALQGVGIHAELTAAKITLAAARAKIAEAEAPTGLFGRMLDVFRTEGQRETRVQAALREVASAENAVANATKAAAHWAEAIDDANTRSLLAERARLDNMKQLLVSARQLKLALETPGFAKGQTAESVSKGKGSDVLGLGALEDSSKLLSKSLNEATRAEMLFHRGLLTMSDAIEEFVVTGTFAFTDFLNNILRMLYRDFADQAVGNIVASVFPSGAAAAAGASGDGPISSGPGAGPSPSVVTNVNFTVQAIDAQGVASFLNSNGPQIAAVVAGHAERSAGLRRKLSR